MFDIEKEILSDKSVVYNLIIKGPAGNIIYKDYSCASLADAEKKLELLNTFSFEGVYNE